jgi:hypothetical protein
LLERFLTTASATAARAASLGFRDQRSQGNGQENDHDCTIPVFHQI